MTQTLAIGPYTEDEKKWLVKTFDPIFLQTPSEISALAETARHAISGVAFKGHHGFGAEEMALLPITTTST